MASKQFALEGIGAITIYKRRGSTSIRLSVTPSGTVRVTVPNWAPYQSGLRFAQARSAWINDQLKTRQQPLLRHGQAIGKAHHLVFRSQAGAPRITTRVGVTDIVVTCPDLVGFESAAAQQAAEAACRRALKNQAERLLPIRVRELAGAHGYQYKSVRVKQLKSRWGSCDHEGNIVLSLFLMQLRWEYIDYVIMHELTHTRHLHHQPAFWQELLRHQPNAKQLRKQIKTFRPVLGAA